jgi:hypothetical protein
LEWEPFVATVVLEALEAMDEDELLREILLRFMNMPLTSSEFIWLLPLIVAHGGREICGKVGGFATAVMGEASW